MMQGRSTAPRTEEIDTTVIDRATRAHPIDADDDRVRYSCQSTRLVEATAPMKWRDPWQYWRDLTSRNVSVWTMIGYSLLAGYNVIVRRTGRGRHMPYINGLAGKKTPSETLNLQVGELVEVKSKAEIMKTIDADKRNRGMSFDAEMTPAIGKRYRVQQRVDRFIDERTGHMIKMKTPAVILEGVTCGGCFSRSRMFCPRELYPYWREIWLKRVNG